MSIKTRAKYLEPGIFYIEDFLEPDELKALQDFCTRSPKWDSVLGWGEESLWTENTRHTAGDQAATDAVYKINLAMAELVNSPIAELRPNYTVNRFRPISNPPIEGSTFWDDDEWSMGPHFDSDYGPLDALSTIEHGVLFYINDDYEGGDVVYTNKGITFKPKANTILVHGGSEEYTHGVKKVTSGERYTLSTFAFTPGSIYL